MNLYLSLICWVFLKHLLCVGGDAVVPKDMEWVLWKQIAGGTEERSKEDPTNYHKREISEDKKALTTSGVEEILTWDREI